MIPAALNSSKVPGSGTAAAPAGEAANDDPATVEFSANALPSPTVRLVPWNRAVLESRTSVPAVDRRAAAIGVAAAEDQLAGPVQGQGPDPNRRR